MLSFNVIAPDNSFPIVDSSFNNGAIIYLYFYPLLLRKWLYSVWLRLCAFVDNNMLLYFRLPCTCQSRKFSWKAHKNQVCQHIARLNNYVITTVYVKLFTTKHHYSIFVETNAVHSIYNFILSTTAEEISDVLLTQRTQVLRQRFSTLRCLHLMLNRHRERIVRFENILICWFCSFYRRTRYGRYC